MTATGAYADTFGKCPGLLDLSRIDFTALNNFISKTVIHRKEKYNTYINANLNGKNNC